MRHANSGKRDHRLAIGRDVTLCPVACSCADLLCHLPSPARVGELPQQLSLDLGMPLTQLRIQAIEWDGVMMLDNT